MASDPVGLHGEEVGARHASEEPVEIGGGLLREEAADPFDRAGEPLRDLRPHLAALEHMVHLRHELPDERLPPRRPGGRSGRLGIGLGEEVQRGESLGRSDHRRDVQDEVLVRQVPTRRGIGKQQMPFDHETDEIAVGRRHAHPIQDRRDHPRAHRDMTALAVLADVVQERPEEHGVAGPVPLGQLAHGLDLDGIVARAGAPEEPAHRPERGREVCVDREAVVRVALWTTAHVRPLGHERGEDPQPIEDLEGRRPPVSGSEEPREPGTHVLIPLHHVRQFEIVDRVQQRRRGLPAGLGLGGQRLQHAGRGRRRRDRRGAVLVEPLDHGAEQELDVARVLEQGPHQPVDRDQPGLVGEPHRVRDRRLMIEQQAIAALARLEVQRAANTGEELLRGRERLALAGAEEPGVLQRPPDRRLEQPDRVEIAPAAGTLLQFGLEEMRGRSGTFCATGGVVTEGSRERPRIAADPRLDPAADVGDERLVAGDEPDVHHRGADVQPGGGLLALLRRADRVTHLEPGVPQGIQQGVREPRDPVGVGSVVHDEQVDVRTREEQASPVAPHRGHGRAGRRAGAHEQIRERAVHELGRGGAPTTPRDGRASTPVPRRGARLGGRRRDRARLPRER